MSGQPQLWTMPGGIEPPAHKARALSQPIRQLARPPRLYVELTQPFGGKPQLCVQAGQQVRKGQVLARGTTETGLTMHAPAAGIVTAIIEHAVPNTSGLPELCAVIDTVAEAGPPLLMPALDYQQTDSATLIQRVADAGICGLGGAGYPTHAKLRAAAGRVDTLILNAAECEPFISTDEALLRERAGDVITGCLILLQLTGATRCLIAIEDDKPQAIAALRPCLNDPRLELRIVPTVYPSGAENQLIYILTGKELHSEALPTDHGMLCHNVGTVYAIARAVVHGEPLLSRITTFTGAALRAPGNYEVLIGTPIHAVLDECELDESQLSQLISGGSLMGISLTHANLPVTKTTNCIIASTMAELPPPLPEQACIRCGFCAEVCPVLLLPQQLYWFARGRELDKAEAHDLHNCHECGACAYVCPSHIPLVQYFRAAKADIAGERDRHQLATHWRRRFEAHQSRKAAEKLVEDQRRAERAALVQKKKAAADELARVGSSADARPSAQEVIAAALARVQAKKAAAARQQNADKGADSGTDADKP